MGTPHRQLTRRPHGREFRNPCGPKESKSFHQRSVARPSCPRPQISPQKSPIQTKPSPIFFPREKRPASAKIRSGRTPGTGFAAFPHSSLCQEVSCLSEPSSGSRRSPSRPRPGAASRASWSFSRHPFRRPARLQPRGQHRLVQVHPERRDQAHDHGRRSRAVVRGPPRPRHRDPVRGCDGSRGRARALS